SLLLLLLGGGVLVIVVFLPIGEHLEKAVDWIESLGIWGVVVLAASYIPASVLMVPGTPISLVTGFLYGVVMGTIAISIGSTLGVSAAFWVGRTLARDWIEERLARNPRFRAIDQAVAQEGFKIVFLTRLSPVFPFNLLNYAFGLTNVRFRDYFIASWIGMLPGTVLYVYLGTLAGDLADLAAGNVEKGPEYYVALVLGLVATVAVTVYATRRAKQALARAAPRAVEPTP